MLPTSTSQSESIMNSAFPADAEFASWKDEAADKDMEVGSLACLFVVRHYLSYANTHQYIVAHIHYSIR